MLHSADITWLAVLSAAIEISFDEEVLDASVTTPQYREILSTMYTQIYISRPHHEFHVVDKAPMHRNSAHIINFKQ